MKILAKRHLHHRVQLPLPHSPHRSFMHLAIILPPHICHFPPTAPPHSTITFPPISQYQYHPLPSQPLRTPSPSHQGGRDPPSHVLYIAQRFLPLSLPSSSLQHTTSAMSLLTCPLHLSDLPPHFRPSSAPPLFRFRAKCVFSIVNMEISIFTESFVISRDGLSKKSANSAGEQIKRERPRSTRGPSGS